MSKVIIEFNLPEEKTEFENFTHLGIFISCITNIDELIRDHRKHNKLTKTQLIKSIHEEIINAMEVIY